MLAMVTACCNLTWSLFIRLSLSFLLTPSSKHIRHTACPLSFSEVFCFPHIPFSEVFLYSPYLILTIRRPFIRDTRRPAKSPPWSLTSSPLHSLFPLQADCVSKARHVPTPLQRPQGGAQGGGGGGCGGRGEEGGGGAGGLDGHHRPLEQAVQGDSKEPGELFGRQLFHGEGERLKPSSLKTSKQEAFKYLMIGKSATLYSREIIVSSIQQVLIILWVNKY